MKKAIKFTIVAALAAACSLFSACSLADWLQDEIEKTLDDETDKTFYDEADGAVLSARVTDVVELAAKAFTATADGYADYADECVITTTGASATKETTLDGVFTAYSASAGLFDCEKYSETLQEQAHAAYLSYGGVELYARGDAALVRNSEGAASAAAAQDVTFVYDPAAAQATVSEGKSYAEQAADAVSDAYSTFRRYVGTQSKPRISLDGRILRLGTVTCDAVKNGTRFSFSLSVEAEVETKLFNSYYTTGTYSRTVTYEMDSRAELTADDFCDENEIFTDYTDYIAYFDVSAASAALKKGFSAGSTVEIETLGGSGLNVGGDWNNIAFGTTSGTRDEGKTSLTTAAVYVDYEYGGKSGTLAYAAKAADADGSENGYISVQNGKIIIDGGLKEAAVAEVAEKAAKEGISAQKIKLTSVSVQLIQYEFDREEEWESSHSASAYFNMPFTTTLCSSRCEL